VRSADQGAGAREWIDSTSATSSTVSAATSTTAPAHTSVPQTSPAPAASATAPVAATAPTGAAAASRQAEAAALTRKAQDDYCDRQPWNGNSVIISIAAPVLISLAEHGAVRCLVAKGYQEATAETVGKLGGGVAQVAELGYDAYDRI
jgi:type V secretory pathway adhesin AidA